MRVQETPPQKNPPPDMRIIFRKYFQQYSACPLPFLQMGPNTKSSSSLIGPKVNDHVAGARLVEMITNCYCSQPASYWYCLDDSCNVWTGLKLKPRLPVVQVEV